MGKVKKIYRGCVDGIIGEYTEKKLYRLYRKTVDKEIYSSYSGWKWDMLRSGTFRYVEIEKGGNNGENNS